MTESTKPKATLEEIEARRECKRQALEAQRLEQHTIDKIALADLEDEYGETNVVWINFPYSPGVVTIAAAHTPTPAQLKRYRDRCKPKGEKQPDYAAAAEELAAATRIYPPKDEEGNAAYDLLCKARPGAHVQLGVAALKLGGGVEQDESKS